MIRNRRRSRRAASVLSLWVLAVACGLPAAAAPSLPDEGEQWIEVRTTHFILFGDAPPDRTIAIGVNLERFRRVLARLVRRLEVNSPLPTWIYVFRDEAAFAPYKKRVGSGPANVSGEFISHRDGNYVGIDASPPVDPWAVVYHEYFHYFLNNNFTDVPLWFNEGIAECYSTFAAGAGRVEIGRPVESHVRWLQSHRWLPLDELFAVHEDSPDYNEGRRQGTFYAESWAVVHYLMWGRRGGGPRGTEFLARFPPGASLQDELGPLLGSDPGELEARVFEYVRLGRFASSAIDIDDLEVEVQTRSRPMSRAETLARLGDYLGRGQRDREADAEAHYRAALELDPSLGAAWSGLGFLSDRAGRRDEAAARYEKALARDPDDALTLFLLAENIMERFSPSGTTTQRPAGAGTPPELARARGLYRRSIRLRPEIGEAYAGLGATYSFEEGGVEEGIKALEKARRMLPSRMDVVVNLAGLYVQTGAYDKARDLVERVLARSGDRELAASGRELLLGADLKRAETLVDSGQVDAGLALLRDVMGKTGDAGLRRTLQGEIARLEERQELGRQVALYNAAVDRVNARDYKKAAAILDDLLKVATDPGLVEQARLLLGRARQGIAAERRP